jgi:hypothetical protein
MSFYDYTASKKYCESLGLMWLGDAFIANADREAKQLNFTQEQVDAAFRHSLWHVKWLFTPQHYRWTQRIGLAFWFLFGRMK